MTDQNDIDELSVQYAIRHPSGTIFDPTSHRRTAEERHLRYLDQWPTAELVIRTVAAGDWVDDGVTPPPPAVPPRRGDAIEAWLKAQRDEYEQRSSPQWQALDDLLDTYRLHADTGTPLGEHVCENGTVDDCYNCYQAQQADSAG